ncbi:MAG: rhomboid family intramembrane serine protease [Opitutaceae bacterium]|jgi:membrane associated rhomboid family serine protease
MLSDRHYMRDNTGRPPISALAWLIDIIAGAFVIENIFLRWFGGNVGQGFFHYLTLSPEGLPHGFVWTLVTHALIHDPNNLLHLGFTLLMLYIFGRAVVQEIGERRMLGLFATAVATGGIVWLAINWSHADRLYGASAGVSALMILFACLDPEQPITLFMIDVGMRAKHLAIAMVAIDVLGLVLVEIPGRGSWFSMAHSAHLGGMAAGWAYYRFFHQRSWGAFTSRPSIELPRWFRKSRKTETPPAAYKVNLESREDLRAEIDRILDKINSKGFQSLTDEEKRRLDQARDQLSRR